MDYSIHATNHGKTLDITVDVTDTQVGTDSLLGLVHKVWRVDYQQEEPFSDWFKRIRSVTIKNVDSCYAATPNVEAFYEFLQGYYNARKRYHWKGMVVK